MAWFLIQGVDHSDVATTLAARAATRPAHLARLQQLATEGRVLAAGPLPHNADDLTQGFEGSVMIVDFPNRAALDAWLADEPYLHAGVYQSVKVSSFLQVFPAQA